MSQEWPGGDRSPQRGAWVLDGLRTAVLLRPRSLAADVSPWGLAGVSAVTYALVVAAQRLALDGKPRFYWQGIGAGWLATVVLIWLCWWVARQAPGLPGHRPPQAATLFSLLSVQGAVTLSVSAAALLLSHRGIDLDSGPYANWIRWGLFGAPLLWAGVAAAWLVKPLVTRWWQRGVVLAALLIVSASGVWLGRGAQWYPDYSQSEQARPAVLSLTQELMEAQSGTLIEALDAVQPQRPGVVDLYTITFAPYAEEDVFSRETAMVSDMMAKRFDAAGHQIQLQNHVKTAASMAWATPLNLERAIDRAAQRMDLEEDILFLHLTSHGAQSGHLSASFYPIDLDDITPQQLRGWLDAAGVRYSVISISACFSGSWIAPLSAPGTLVMTAADAEHTSYGCGRRSPLTFFGRAMYDEQLRNSTRSFEQAHAAARTVIEQREKEAGKDDGYSNPQIAVGADIRARLAALEAALAGKP